jgi:hypothetical protein
LRLTILFLITASFVVLAYGQTQETSTNQKNFVPYTENSNVEFTEDGKIDYDLLIAKIMPDIFVEKLHALGANVTAQDIVLERGFHILIYQPQSYNCGYAIDHQKNKAYWLEAAINSTHIQHANIYEEIPRDPDSVASFDNDCFSLLETQVAEIFLKEKSYFTPDEEARAIAAVKHDLRGNENLNSYQIKVGKFNYDFNDTDLLSICGEFVGRTAGSKYFLAILHKSGQLSLSLEKKLSPLCAIDKNSTLYDIKFQNIHDQDTMLQTWQNKRHETVHLKPASAGKLLERNYLYVDSINNLDLKYSSHLELEYVDFQPEKSTTILTFTPPKNDSYMKIRLPDSTPNYYLSYGNEDWNVRKLLGISILVDEKKTDYSQFSYVRSPEAPYPAYFTDLVFKVPANSTAIAVHLDIENYDFNEVESKEEWQNY